MNTEKYIHHGKEVVVVSKIKGKHRDICLCYDCDKFNMEDEDNKCHIANAVYKNCVEFNLVTPVVECAEFEKY